MVRLCGFIMKSRSKYYEGYDVTTLRLETLYDFIMRSRSESLIKPINHANIFGRYYLLPGLTMQTYLAVSSCYQG